MVRFNTGTEDSGLGFFSENRKPSSAVRNVITEEPKQAEVFGSPEIYHTVSVVIVVLLALYTRMFSCNRYDIVKLEISEFFTFNTNISTRGHPCKV